MTDNGNIFLPCLAKLSCTVTEVLNNTNKYAFLVKTRYEQASSTLEMYKTSTKLCNSKCTCLNEEANVESNLDFNLMKAVSKTLTHAQSIRSQSSKSKLTNKISSERLNSRKSISNNNFKTNTLINETHTNTKVKEKSKSNDVHAPSCPLYDCKTPSTHRFVPNVPVELIKCAKLYHTFVTNLESGKNNSSKKSNRSLFLQELEEHNEQIFLKSKKVDQGISVMPKYFSKLPRVEDSFEKSEFLYMMYNNAQDLKNCQMLQIYKLNEESWNKILEAVVLYVIPILQSSKLNTNDRMYSYKIIKTIYNLARNNNPNVPIFKLQ